MRLYHVYHQEYHGSSTSLIITEDFTKVVKLLKSLEDSHDGVYIDTWENGLGDCGTDPYFYGLEEYISNIVSM